MLTLRLCGNLDFILYSILAKIFMAIFLVITQQNMYLFKYLIVCN